MSQIQLSNLQKNFGNTPVLANVNLTIDKGEFCVFIGPSGCGKSTLLRIIAGLDDPTSGEIRIAGRQVNDLPPAKRDVAMVFQSYALYPHMTVYENMAFGLRHLGLPKLEIDQRVQASALALHLGPMLDRKPGALSGGQRQRVAIGRAIVRKPKVFLFDEPLSNLDASLRVKTRVELARLHRELQGSTSMVYVTHDQVEAMTLADKIVLLRPLAGQSGVVSIAQVGDPLTLYHRPANQFVAGFIGSPGMNFIPGLVAGATQHQVDVKVGAIQQAASVQGDGLTLGANVTLGIRPEHVVTGSGDLIGEVVHIERLGEHAFLYLDTPLLNQPLVAKVQHHGLPLGSRLPFTLPPDALHLFCSDGTSVKRTH